MYGFKHRRLCLLYTSNNQPLASCKPLHSVPHSGDHPFHFGHSPVKRRPFSILGSGVKSWLPSNIGGKGNMLSATTTLDPEEVVGEGFRPTDLELATYYLKLMLEGKYILVDRIPVVDIYKHEPSDLPNLSRPSLSRSEWYLFCPRPHENGSRRSRLTEGGFWKSTGKDRVIKDADKGDTLFKKKSLIYYTGRSGHPDSSLTNWAIHEIRAIRDDGTTQGDYVICKVFKKPGKNAMLSTDSEGEPISGMASVHNHLRLKRKSEFSAPTSCKRNSSRLISTFEHSCSISNGQADYVEDEPILEMDFEKYLGLPGENFASYTTIPQQVTVEQQPAVSNIGYNEQYYGHYPIPESCITPEANQLSVYDYGFLG